MMKTLLLADGMYLIHSSFYANPNLRTLSGEHTGALYGFILRLESVLKEFKPSAVVVAFDSPQKGFRWELFPAYKEKRLKAPEELQQQVPLIKEYLHLRGIEIMEIPRLEADDIIALASCQAEKDFEQVLIYSADKDLFQLVGKRVKILEPRSRKILDREGIRSRFGVYPEQVVDYLALVGDSSDNIEGVAGVGEKTALKFFACYSSLDEFFQNPERLEIKLQTKILASREKIVATRKLLDLRQLPFEFELKLPAFRDEHPPELNEFYRRFALHSFLKQQEESTPLPTVRVLTKEAEIVELKAKLIAAGDFFFDLETSSLNFWQGEIVGMGIAVNDELFYLPFRSTGESDSYGLDRQNVFEQLKEALESEQIKKSGHNLKFDLLFLKSCGINCKPIGDDSMLISYLLFPNRRSHNLKDLALEILNKKMVSFDQLGIKDPRELFRLPVEKVAAYCADDALSSRLLVQKLKTELTEKGLEKLYSEIEMRLMPVLMEMEFTGIKIDRDFLEASRTHIEQIIARCEQEIYQLAGYEFNLNSQQQLGNLLFEKFKLPVGKKTKKSGVLSTDNEVLNSLRSFPIVEKIIDYRAAKKLLSTYIEGLLEKADQRSVIHTSFNQTVTATGRLSSSDPNLQNIPVGETFGLNLRRAFLAPPGQVFLSADYSQIELRVLAHLSDDPLLKEAFRNDLDIHSYTAELVFKKSNLSAQEKRRRAKIINFSVLYGKTAFSLSKELNIDYQQAKDFIDNYFQTYHGVSEFIQRTVAVAEKSLLVRTVSGRLRPVPEISSSNRNVRENGKRIAVNTVIQGSAADLIKIAMVRIHDRLMKMRSKLLLQVHDELVFSAPPEEEEELLRIVCSEMESALELTVPLKVSLKRGKNWGELEELTS